MKDKCEFEKKVFVSQQIYGDIPGYLRVIDALLNCMKETNKHHGKQNEYFRLTYKPSQTLENNSSFDVMELRWGYKDEEEVKKSV